MALSLFESNGQAVARFHFDATLGYVFRKFVGLKSACSRLHSEEATAASAPIFNIHFVQTIRYINLAYAEQPACHPAAKNPEWPGRRQRAQRQFTTEAGLKTSNHDRP